MLLSWFPIALAGDGWFHAPPEVALEAPFEVPLLRSATDPRPAVEALVGERPTLAVIDLAGSWTRVGWGPVVGAGLKTRRVEGQSGWQTRVVLPEVRIGELVLRDIHAQVVVGEELVIGLSAIPALELAVLPSAGVVRLAPEGAGLVAAVGPPEPRDPQPLGPWWELGEQRFGDGATARVPALVQVPAAPQGLRGTVHLRTDRRDTVLGPAVPTDADHGGRGTALARIRLGEGTAPFTHGQVDDRVADPAPDWLGAVGYDALFAFDLAAGSEGIATNPAARVLWTDPSPEVDRLQEAADGVGEGDRCLPWLVLGIRQLREGEPDPMSALERGMGLWTAWESLDRRQRDRVRAGRDPELGAPQDPECAEGTGRWLTARLATGEDPREVADDARAFDDGLSAWTPLAGGLAHLAAGDPEGALPSLRTAWARQGEGETWLALAVVHGLAGRDRLARDLLDRLVWEDPNPLLTALVTARLGLLPEEDGPERPGSVARAVVRAALGPDPIPEALVRQVRLERDRTADAAWTLAADRALCRLEGRECAAIDAALARWEARSPEPWVARVLDPDPDVSAMGAAVLRARFPEWAIPLDQTPETP